MQACSLWEYAVPVSGNQCNHAINQGHALLCSLQRCTVNYKALFMLTNRMGTVEPFTLIEGPEAWYAADYKGRTDWINHLSAQHIQELDAAVSGIMARGVQDIHVSGMQEQRRAWLWTNRALSQALRQSNARGAQRIVSRHSLHPCRL